METEKESLLRHQLDESGLKLAKLSNELNRITKSLEHTQSDLKTQAHRTKVLWGVAIVLVACILGIAWVGSPLLTEHGGAALESMGGGLGQTEANVRDELAEARNSDEQQSLRIGELAKAQLSTRGHVASMELQLSSGQDRMDALSSEVDRQRVDFEVSKNRADQLVEGVYLTVRKTDVGKQQVDGWLHIVSDGRIVWLRDVGAQHPIAFASTSDARPYQLVFTKIAGKGVVGYLMVPKVQASGEGAN